MSDFPISDLRLAAICGLAYTVPATFDSPNAHVAITVEAGVVIVSFRGSKSLIDWVRDFLISPASSSAHPQLGVCHAGFLFDVVPIAAKIAAYLAGHQFVVCGHSKGGAEAQIFAALCIVNGLVPARLVTFGAPRCAWVTNTQLPDLISQIPGPDYRCLSDPVTQAPLPYIHGRRAPSFVQLGVPHFDFYPIPDHFLASYAALIAG